MATINLPVASGALARYTLPSPRPWPRLAAPPKFNRVAFAAAHVVADARADVDPWLDEALDWDATIAYRRHLWSHGFGVAEAMDTAQRGMGLGWPTALELIRRSADAAREMVRDGLGELLDYAGPAGMPLAIEPLHPMYAAERACVNTMAHANDLCDELAPRGGDGLGLAVDIYHVWWDPHLEAEIERAGAAERLFAYHICDWLVPTRDLLNDRGMMGDGVVDLPTVRGWMERAGYRGLHEVEIFSDRWWAEDPRHVLATCIERHARCT